ncbi:MAG: serine/threonine protein kinase, partial [Gammaproteobacteria bacterium]
KANPFGLYDTVGNVWEWCTDNWHENYEGAPTDGSVWKGGEESLRVLRGGSWYYDPSFARTAFRYGGSPDVRYDDFGFRVAARIL